MLRWVVFRDTAAADVDAGSDVEAVLGAHAEEAASSPGAAASPESESESAAPGPRPTTTPERPL
jgi:hypothetical protein